MSRLFVAVWPPPAVVEQLARLPRADVPGVRWTRPEQWHVTLRFLGEADEDEAAGALAQLRERAAEAVLGPRPGRLGREVLMVPVHGLEALAAAVVALTGSIGRPPERSFLGHLTLARLKGRAACGLTGEVVSARWPVTSVDLVASRPGPDGSRYRTVVTVPLEAPAVTAG